MLRAVNPSRSAPEKRAFDATFRESVRANLSRFERKPQTDPKLRAAAVAIVLTANEAGEACFLITRRTSGLRNHSGQWALPGGRLDEGETVVEAALRETNEEIGLILRPADVLGMLDDFATRSGFRMTPIVCWAEPGQSIRLDPIEVEQLHTIPLSELEMPEVPILEDIPESDRPVLSVPLPAIGQRIYSPTAAILFQMREVVLAGRATRVSHYEQPVFAWK
jgi:8-oxo-dGTP pyrophosphatase MutT (NUDIX family)